MNRTDDRHLRFAFTNPFKMILSKNSYTSPKHDTLLCSFEKKLAETIRKTTSKNVLTISWIHLAVACLCETHTNLVNLIDDLEFPASYWSENWVEIHLNDSIKLLDICNAFRYELNYLSQKHLVLKCFAHKFGDPSKFPSLEQMKKLHASVSDWTHDNGLNNSILVKCMPALRELAQTTNLVKVKNSAKGKILLRAMYGVKVYTVFICSVISVGFSYSPECLMDLNVPSEFLWSEAFNDCQSNINKGLRRQITSGGLHGLRRLDEVNECIQKLEEMMNSVRSTGHEESETFLKYVPGLRESIDNLSRQVCDLSKQVDSFFKVVLLGRSALLDSLRSLHPKRENMVKQ